MGGDSVITAARKARTFHTTNVSLSACASKTHSSLATGGSRRQPTFTSRKRISATSPTQCRAPCKHKCWSNHWNPNLQAWNFWETRSRKCRTFTSETRKPNKGSPRCSSDGVAAVDFAMPDGSSEDYPILLEVADASDGEWARRKQHVKMLKRVEGTIERAIFDCRFFALMGVVGSLIGSFLCFVKGSFYVYKSICIAAFDVTQGLNSYKVVLKLIEALDTYLVATVMLIFGMGLYELFVNELEAVATTDSAVCCNSNLFGLFRLRERPKWLQINGLDALKEKLGHVIVMILLVGMFEKSKKVPVRNGIDLLCVAASVLLCAGSLYLLSQLSKNHGSGHS